MEGLWDTQTLANNINWIHEQIIHNAFVVARKASMAPLTMGRKEFWCIS